MTTLKVEMRKFLDAVAMQMYGKKYRSCSSVQAAKVRKRARYYAFKK